MKKLIVLALFAITSIGSINAQVDLKINPLGILFNRPEFSAEYLVNEDIGVEATIGIVYGKNVVDLDQSGYRLTLLGKYYFSPDDGNDKFYAGAYLGPRSRKITNSYEDFTGASVDSGYKVSAFAAGVVVGYKWVSARGILFELGFGAGRAFGEKLTWNDDDSSGDFDGFGFDVIGTLAVGYRFGGK